MFLLIYFHFLNQNSWKRYIINRILNCVLLTEKCVTKAWIKSRKQGVRSTSSTRCFRELIHAWVTCFYINKTQFNMLYVHVLSVLSAPILFTEQFINLAICFLSWFISSFYRKSFVLSTDKKSNTPRHIYLMKSILIYSKLFPVTRIFTLKVDCRFVQFVSAHLKRHWLYEMELSFCCHIVTWRHTVQIKSQSTK